MTDNDRGMPLPMMQEVGSRRSLREAAFQAEVASRLCKSGYSDLQYVSCDLCDGVLTLRGRVSSFYLKQVAQALIAQMDHIMELDNRLEVDTPQDFA